MLLKPKKTKYNKLQRGRFSRVVVSFKKLKNGHFGLIAQECGFITPYQIESCRKVINRHIKRKGQIWINIFPHVPLTSKPTEVRMGKGKGPIKTWVCKIKKGSVLFEVGNAIEKSMYEALLKAKKKLPVKTLIYKSPRKILVKSYV